MWVHCRSSSVECDKRRLLVLSSEGISADAMSFCVDVWNFQEVRLNDAVVFKNWRCKVKCFVR